MPSAPSRPCRSPGCSALVAAGQGAWCDAHARTSTPRFNRQRFDAARGSAAERGYDYRWQQARAVFLAKYPLCPGVLMPTDYWTRELAEAFHAERERRREVGQLLWLKAAFESKWSDYLSAFSFHAWEITRPAVVVDHIIPHKGDLDLMWAEWNWQPLTKRAHDRKTATENNAICHGRAQP